jgi:broad specificity phosphatase PhoE
MNHEDEDIESNLVIEQKNQNEVDPPLTKKGMEQASEAGKYLKQYFEDNNLKFDEIKIKSSPFVRCIMTSSQLAQSLGIS